MLKSLKMKEDEATKRTESLINVIFVYLKAVVLDIINI